MLWPRRYEPVPPGLAVPPVLSRVPLAGGAVRAGLVPFVPVQRAQPRQRPLHPALVGPGRGQPQRRRCPVLRQRRCPPRPFPAPGTRGAGAAAPRAARRALSGPGPCPSHGHPQTVAPIRRPQTVSSPRASPTVPPPNCVHGHFQTLCVSLRDTPKPRVPPMGYPQTVSVPQWDQPSCMCPSPWDTPHSVSPPWGTPRPCPPHRVPPGCVSSSWGPPKPCPHHGQPQTAFHTGHSKRCVPPNGTPQIVCFPHGNPFRLCVFPHGIPLNCVSPHGIPPKCVLPMGYPQTV